MGKDREFQAAVVLIELNVTINIEKFLSVGRHRPRKDPSDLEPIWELKLGTMFHIGHYARSNGSYPVEG